MRYKKHTYKKKNWWIRNYYRIKISGYIMRYFHILGTYRHHYGENVLDISIPIPCDRYNKKGIDTGIERKQIDATKTIMHSGSRPNHEGTTLLVVRSVLWCVHLMGNIRTTKKSQAGDKAWRGRRQGAKAKRRPPRGGRFSLKLFLPGAFGWSGVISHDTSR